MIIIVQINLFILQPENINEFFYHKIVEQTEQQTNKKEEVNTLRKRKEE